MPILSHLTSDTNQVSTSRVSDRARPPTLIFYQKCVTYFTTYAVASDIQFKAIWQKCSLKIVLFWNQLYRTCILIRTLVLFGISVFIRNTLYFRSSTRRSPIHQNDWFVEAVIITFHKPWASKLHTLHFFTYLKLFLSWDRILIHEECLSERKFPSKFLIWRWQPKNISILTKI